MHVNESALVRNFEIDNSNFKFFYRLWGLKHFYSYEGSLILKEFWNYTRPFSALLTDNGTSHAALHPTHQLTYIHQRLCTADLKGRRGAFLGKLQSGFWLLIYLSANIVNLQSFAHWANLNKGVSFKTGILHDVTYTFVTRLAKTRSVTTLLLKGNTIGRYRKSVNIRGRTKTIQTAQ
jgi:hypothetical protein